MVCLLQNLSLLLFLTAFLGWVLLRCASWQGHLWALIVLLGNTLAQMVRARVFVNKLAQAFSGERWWDPEWNMKRGMVPDRAFATVTKVIVYIETVVQPVHTTGSTTSIVTGIHRIYHLKDEKLA